VGLYLHNTEDNWLVYPPNVGHLAHIHPLLTRTSGKPFFEDRHSLP
jgi:hypothetical protein